jgi:protein involved in polysaccharide export with SLBB domain
MKMIHVNRHTRASSTRRKRRGLALAASLATVILGGCTALTQPIDGVPANRLPEQFFAAPKNNLVPVDISLLSIEPPREYQVDKGDILGVYIEGVLPFNPPNETPQPPPVNFPTENSLLPPSLGFPIAIQEDGTLSLPLIAPLEVRGLTLDQVRDRIREAYIAEDILRPDKARPIVSLIKERTYNVIVVRQDGAGRQGGAGLQNQSLIAGAIRGTSDLSASASVVKLPAYQNDILHALVQTGGLPGLQGRNEVKVLRARDADRRKRAEFLTAFNAQQRAAMLDPCACPPPMPDDPSILRIPLRLPPGQLPDITPDQVVLEDGDIVYIEARETEVFYTGGLLPGGEFQLPRDYDLDVLGAIAIAGGNVGGAQVGPGFGAAALFGGRSTVVPPGMLYILRKTPCNGQVAIEVNLTKAINDPRQRPLVQPGDILILQYSCEEDLLNAGASAFSTFGVAEILRQSR